MECSKDALPEHIPRHIEDRAQNALGLRFDQRRLTFDQWRCHCFGTTEGSQHVAHDVDGLGIDFRAWDADRFVDSLDHDLIGSNQARDDACACNEGRRLFPLWWKLSHPLMVNNIASDGFESEFVQIVTSKFPEDSGCRDILNQRSGLTEAYGEGSYALLSRQQSLDDLYRYRNGRGNQGSGQGTEAFTMNR